MPDEQAWREIAIGGTEINPGSTERVNTGAWRSEMPIIDFSRCTHCMICWVDCPDACFEISDTRLAGIDLDHCKGCGICAAVCPTHCITMVPESSVPVKSSESGA
ncbi:MAG: 4Fe-4S binding protein [Chloroflexi bacterium]|nr:4Fe-4S binding protein [Chloroflexota bacterium]